MITKSKLQKGLPKYTKSICPECKKILDARIFEDKGKVYIEKTCSEHGYFKDVVWSDVKKYLEAEEWAYDGTGIFNPQIRDAKICPLECGICNLHLSHTVLANIDLTNRCNLRCPICFANSNAAGYLYEPSFEQVVEMLKMLRANRPVPCTAVQFSGGEPTLHPRFLDIVREAKRLGFAQIQVATNGLKLANDPEFAQQVSLAGMDTIYLQFDGLDDDIYIHTRGRPLLDIKKRAIENCKNVKFDRASICLVPTIVNGVNDDQIGDMLRFAIENSEIIKGVNFQPVSFSGRISLEEREKQRFTLTDLVSRIEEQTDFLTKDDFYPVPCVVPLSKLISALHSEECVAFTAHPHCGLATYIIIDKKGNVVPITRFIDVPNLLRDIDKIADSTKNSFTSKFGTKLRLIKLRKYINKRNLPESMELRDFMKSLESVFYDNTKTSITKFSWKTMMIGGMHFQDDYNYDIERVKHCVIHYATPDGRIIPFCAYNGGPCYRNEIEKKFSVPLRGGDNNED